MIDPKELMIGNKVLLQNNKTEVLISQIDNRSNLIEVELPDGGLILRKKGLLNPIPLTPEILERCGFVQKVIISGLNKYSLGTIKLLNSSDGFIFDHSHNNGRVVLTSLHHLQNTLTVLGHKFEVK